MKSKKMPEKIRKNFWEKLKKKAGRISKELHEKLEISGGISEGCLEDFPGDV